MLKVSSLGNSPYVHIPKFGCKMLDSTKFQKLIFCVPTIHKIKEKI